MLLWFSLTLIYGIRVNSCSFLPRYYSLKKSLPLRKKSLTLMVTNSIKINETNSHLLPSLIEHQIDYDI